MCVCVCVCVMFRHMSRVCRSLLEVFSINIPEQGKTKEFGPFDNTRGNCILQHSRKVATFLENANLGMWLYQKNEKKAPILMKNLKNKQ